MATGAKLGEAMTDTLIVRPICVAAQRIEGIIAISCRILIKRRVRRRIDVLATVPAVALSRASSDPLDPLSGKSPAGFGGALCAVVSVGPGLLEAVGTEDVPDGEFCETSNETVPVVKSSAKKSEADLPKLPERLIGAPNENVGKKIAIRGRWGAASAATHCDCLSLDVQLLIVFFIIC